MTAPSPRRPLTWCALATVALGVAWLTLPDLAERYFASESQHMCGPRRPHDDGRLATHAYATRDGMAKDVARAGVPMAAPGVANVGMRAEQEERPTPGRFEDVGETGFVAAATAPESTVALETDTASYAIVRQQLRAGVLPIPAMVRLEELVNAFHYAYRAPADGEPLAVDVELTTCPWASGHRVARVGFQASPPPPPDRRPPANLVLLIDVSGSMSHSLKLPMILEGFMSMVGALGPRDRVAIAVYAGAAGLVLPSTPAVHVDTIVESLARLQAGGSTNGAAGIQLAYEEAERNFIPGGINRVMLCTDGDFNVGVTGTAALVDLALRFAAKKILLTVLGVGQSAAFNDAMMETLSNKCDGHYAFLDTPSEARRVLVEQLTGTLLTVARDAKLQVVFDPARVASYRLLGYENRRLAKEDFDDDRKDAGEIGAGHTATALYEIIPTEGPVGDPRAPLLHVRLRYKKLDAVESTLREVAVPDAGVPYAQASGETQLALAVAEFALTLHRSKVTPQASFDAALELAQAAVGRFEDGRPPADLAARKELVELIEIARKLEQPIQTR